MYNYKYMYDVVSKSIYTPLASSAVTSRRLKSMKSSIF